MILPLSLRFWVCHSLDLREDLSYLVSGETADLSDEPPHWREIEARGYWCWECVLGVLSFTVCASLWFTALPAYHLSDKLQRVGQGHTEWKVFISSGKCYIFPVTQRRETQTEASSFWSFPKNHPAWLSLFLISEPRLTPLFQEEDNHQQLLIGLVSGTFGAGKQWAPRKEERARLYFSFYQHMVVAIHSV